MRKTNLELYELHWSTVSILDSLFKEQNIFYVTLLKCQKRIPIYNKFVFDQQYALDDDGIDSSEQE